MWPWFCRLEFLSVLHVSFCIQYVTINLSLPNSRKKRLFQKLRWSGICWLLQVIIDFLNSHISLKRRSTWPFFALLPRVIIQNERYTNEEWKRIFSNLMLAFKSYQSEITHFVLANIPGVKDPSHVSIRLSAARETNILEALNLALSGFLVYCFYIDFRLRMLQCWSEFWSNW